MKHTVVLLVILLHITTGLCGTAPTKKESIETSVEPCYRSFVGLIIAVDEEKLIFSPEQLADGAKDHAKKMIAKALEDKGEYLLIVSNYLLNHIDYFNTSNSYTNNWDARRLSQNVSLLIPKDKTAWFVRSGYPRSVPEDYLFGMRIADKKALKKADLSDKRIYWEYLSKEALDDLRKLFIPRSEYLRKKLETKEYHLVFLGHGLAPQHHERPTTGPIIHLGGRIAGFAVEDLRTALFTLAGRHLTRAEELAYSPADQNRFNIPGIINIASLTLVSCFTGDLNALATFTRSQERLGENYDFNFPIILATPLATTTTAITALTSFPTFFSSLQANCVAPDFAQALNAIFETSGKNLPVIKRPGIPRFFPLDPARHIEIGSIMGETRTQPIRIPSDFGKTSIETILIRAPVIRAPVILEEMIPLPPIFSSQEGPSGHNFIGGIQAPKYTFSQVIGAFTSARQIAWKGFRFKSITAIDDVEKKDLKVKQFTDVFIINYVVPEKKDGLFYQNTFLAIAYTLDGKRYIDQKDISKKTTPDALSGDEASKSEAEKQGGIDIESLWSALQEIAENPIIARRDQPIIDVKGLNELLERQKKRMVDDKNIEQLATSLQILTQ